MNDDARKPKGKGGGGRKRGKRSKDRHFMDAALDAYIRNQSLTLWRDYVVYRERHEKSAREALVDVGYFGDREGYAAMWSSHWERTVLPAADQGEGELFAQIEASVRAAVLDEKAARIAAGGVVFEDTPDYSEFVTRAMNRLIHETSAESDR